MLFGKGTSATLPRTMVHTRVDTRESQTRCPRNTAFADQSDCHTWHTHRPTNACNLVRLAGSTGVQRLCWSVRRAEARWKQYCESWQPTIKGAVHTGNSINAGRIAALLLQKKKTQRKRTWIKGQKGDRQPHDSRAATPSVG